MAGHHKYSELVKKMSPKRQAEIEAGAREMMADMVLSEIRKLAGLTQVQVAEEMGVSQAAMSQLESQKDMRVSTLQRLVEALGGTLEIVVNLPTGRVSVSQFRQVA